MTIGNLGAALYANCFRIGHNADEFIVEAGQAYEDEEGFIVICRLAITPRTARELHRLLGESLTARTRLLRSNDEEGM